MTISHFEIGAGYQAVHGSNAMYLALIHHASYMKYHTSPCSFIARNDLLYLQNHWLQLKDISIAMVLPCNVVCKLVDKTNRCFQQFTRTKSCTVGIRFKSVRGQSVPGWNSTTDRWKKMQEL